MWPLLQVEVRKLVARRETLILGGVFALLPILLTYSMAHGGDTVTVRGQYDFLNLPAIVIGLLGSLLFPYLAVVLVAASTMGREVDDGSIKILLLRATSRSAFYAAKVLATVAFSVALLVTIGMGAVVGYLLFVRGGPHDAGNVDVASVRLIVNQLASTALGLSILGGLTVLISLKLGFGGSIGGGIGVLVLMKVGERMEVVRQFIPTFLADASHYLAPGGVVSQPVPYVFLPLYLVAALTAGLTVFRRMDVRR